MSNNQSVVANSKSKPNRKGRRKAKNFAFAAPSKGSAVSFEDFELSFEKKLIQSYASANSSHKTNPRIDIEEVRNYFHRSAELVQSHVKAVQDDNRGQIEKIVDDGIRGSFLELVKMR